MMVCCCSHLFSTSLVARRPYSKFNIIGRVRPAFEKVRFPEKLKGTFIEKWADYWKGVLSDYAQVGRDVATDAVNNPAKAAAIVATISFLGYCAHTNPDDNHFRDRLLEHVNSFAMIAQPVRNSNSVSYIMQLATAYNAGQVRLFSAGFFTVVWLADYNSSMGQYKANCNYLSPSVFDFHKRIVDIGFLNRWWLIDYKMLDYDVSLEEWNKT